MLSKLAKVSISKVLATVEKINLIGTVEVCGAPSHVLPLLQMQAAFTTSFISSSGGTLPGGSSLEGERLLQLIGGGGGGRRPRAGPELEGRSIPYLFMVRN